MRRETSAVLALPLVCVASCDAFSDANPPAADDGGADAATDVAMDATAGEGAPASDRCEALATDPLDTLGGVRALAAGVEYLYAATTAGLFLRPVTSAGAPLKISDDVATDIVVTDNYVVWRREDGGVRRKPKTNLIGDAGDAYGSTNTNAIEPRVQDDYVVVRPTDVYGCPAAGGACTGTILARSVRDVVMRGVTFDFLADDGDGIGVYHCASACTAADAGARLAKGGLEVPDLVSDDGHLYWIDRAAGRVRRVARAGGPVSDVMTGLVAPRFVALDSTSRILVGTQTHGVFRGAIAATCVAPADAASEPVAAMASGPTGVFIASGDTLRIVRQ